MAADKNPHPKPSLFMAVLLAVAGTAALAIRLLVWPRAQRQIPLPKVNIPEPDTGDLTDDLPISGDISESTPDDQTPPAPVSAARWLIFFAIIVAAALLFYLLPGDLAVPAFFTMTAVSLLAAAVAKRGEVRSGLQETFRALVQVYRTSSLPLNLVYDRPVALLQAGIEISVVVMLALLVTTDYRVSDNTLKLKGLEAEWLTSSAYFASNSLHEYGYIPLWQPYLEFGEPLIDQPFSFVLNPISAGPSLIEGGVQGIKHSVVLSVILAGVGGWFLARVLGLGTLGRLVLAVMLIGKGNMQAMIGMGYFQLGVTQAYFPWIIGGTIALLRMPRRWPVALTAVSFTLMFWAGNIWYTLPMLLSMGALMVSHTFFVGNRLVNWPAVWRFGLTLVLIAGLAAITLLPLFAQQQNAVGGHHDEKLQDEQADLDFVIGQFFDGSLQPYNDFIAPGGIQFYYSYVVPLAFVLILFVIVPPIWPFLHRPGIAAGSRIWIPALMLILWHISWGAGGNSVIEWLYHNVPLLGQWRFVGRALAAASFWIAVLVAMRVDGLARAMMALNWRDAGRALNRSLKTALLSLVAVGVIYTGSSVNSRWQEIAPLEPLNIFDNRCVEWIRKQFPDQELSIYLHGYHAVYTFLDNNARLWPIEADYFPIPLDNTISQVYMVNFDSKPEFALAWTEIDRGFLRDAGYRPMIGSPDFEYGYPCVWRNTDTYAYAYWLPAAINWDKDQIRPENATPIAFDRKPDRIVLRVIPGPEEARVVTIQELAYPGWEVFIDGQRANLESFGGQSAVWLPPSTDGREREVVFQYRPPLLFIGGIFTLITWAFCILYLLHAERLLPARWRRWIEPEHIL